MTFARKLLCKFTFRSNCSNAHSNHCGNNDTDDIDTDTDDEECKRTGKKLTKNKKWLFTNNFVQLVQYLCWMFCYHLGAWHVSAIFRSESLRPGSVNRFMTWENANLLMCSSNANADFVDSCAAAAAAAVILCGDGRYAYTINDNFQPFSWLARNCMRHLSNDRLWLAQARLWQTWF